VFEGDRKPVERARPSICQGVEIVYKEDPICFERNSWIRLSKPILLQIETVSTGVDGWYIIHRSLSVRLR